MASEKPYMYCRQCGIQLRSDKVAEHESQCKANDTQKKSSPNHGSSKKEAGNKIRDVSNSDTRSSNGTKEVKTKTVTEKDGVKEIEETVEYTSDPPSSSSKDGGSLEIEDMNKEESDNMSKNGKDDLIAGGNRSNQKRDDEHADSKPFPTSEKVESKKNEKKDIGKHPYPTKDAEQKETTTVEEVDPVDEFIQRLPEFDRQAEAAYQSHQENLTPCSHCERHFTPDRLQKHESVCGERPTGHPEERK